MDYLFAVTFQSQNKPQYFLCNYEINKGELVVCESLRGVELGRVCTEPKEYEVKEGEEIPFSYILRIATEEDIKAFEDNKKDAEDAIKIVQNQANNCGLEMNVNSAEFTLDKTKLTVSYLSEDRVDFRELLKVLASLYHCRIEMRQIGPRDKAKIVGGIGVCGLPLCCSSFLNEFDGITINMAKNQMLTLNIQKLSGHCGKLICCLKYEDETYSIEKKNLPRVGLRVKYNDILYRISSINIITKMVRLESSENIISLPLSSLNGYMTYSNANGQLKEEHVIKYHEDVKIKKEDNINLSFKEEEKEVVKEVSPVVEEEKTTVTKEENQPKKSFNNNNKYNKGDNRQKFQNKNNQPRRNDNVAPNKPQGEVKEEVSQQASTTPNNQRRNNHHFYHRNHRSNNNKKGQENE